MMSSLIHALGSHLHWLAVNGYRSQRLVEYVLAQDAATRRWVAEGWSGDYVDCSPQIQTLA